MLRALAASFVEPEGGVTVLSSVIYGIPFAGIITFDLPLDFTEDQTIAGGMEVLTPGGWLAADNVYWDDEAPSQLVAIFTDAPDGMIVDLPWRLVPPVSGWTAGGGRVLGPMTGVWAPEPAAKAANIAADKVLTKLLQR